MCNPSPPPLPVFVTSGFSRTSNPPRLQGPGPGPSAWKCPGFVLQKPAAWAEGPYRHPAPSPGPRSGHRRATQRGPSSRGSSREASSSHSASFCLSLLGLGWEKQWEDPQTESQEARRSRKIREPRGKSIQGQNE